MSKDDKQPKSRVRINLTGRGGQSSSSQTSKPDSRVRINLTGKRSK